MKISKYDLYVAIRAALHAGAEIAGIYEDPLADWEVEQKADNSPLTIADRKSNDVILSYLSSTTYPILSEEGKVFSYEERKSWNTFWMIDPLDGTKNFLKRNGEFTVNIALIVNNEPILGVIYIPVRETVYYAAVGKGAYKINKCVFDDSGDMDALLQRAVKLPLHERHDGFIVASSRSCMNEQVRSFMDKLRERRSDVSLVICGSAIKFCMVAEGSADIYPRFAPCMEWDTAAGHVIARECGCEIYQATGNEALKYNKADLMNPWFVMERVRE